MNKLTTITLMVMLGFAFTGCFESGSESSPPPEVETNQSTPTAPAPIGLVADGATYYQSNCASCHSVGADDPTSAFGAADLAQRQDMIATDMSNFDTTSSFNLMLAFNNVPEQRVADLQAYFESIPRI